MLSLEAPRLFQLLVTAGILLSCDRIGPVSGSMVTFAFFLL